MHKIAFIGCGNMAREHAKVFSSFNNVSLAGVYSRTPEKAMEFAKEFNIQGIHNSILNLYKYTQANLVIICVPEMALNSIYRECTRYDWTIFTEKPAGYSYKDAEQIYALSKVHLRETFVGLNRRFYSSVRYIQTELRDTDKRYVHIQDQQNFEEARFYKHPEPVVENFMYANSIHTIDLFNVFCRGELNKVQPIIPWQGENSDIVLVSLEYSSGDIGLYEGFWKGPGPWSCVVSTASDRWILQPLEKARVQRKNKRQLDEIPLDEKDILFKPGFYDQAKELIHYLEKGSSQSITLQTSFKTMNTIHQIFGF